MLRQFFRLILFVLVLLKNFVFKYPGALLGLLTGGFAGFVLGSTMVRFGFPGWVLPVQVIAYAVVVAPIVKNYMSKLKG